MRCTPSRRVGSVEVDDRSRRPGDRRRSPKPPIHMLTPLYDEEAKRFFSSIPMRHRRSVIFGYLGYGPTVPLIVCSMTLVAVLPSCVASAMHRHGFPGLFGSLALCLGFAFAMHLALRRSVRMHLTKFKCRLAEQMTDGILTVCPACNAKNETMDESCHCGCVLNPFAVEESDRAKG